MAKLEIDDLIAAVRIVTELQATVREQDAALVAIQAELKGLDQRLRALEPKPRSKTS